MFLINIKKRSSKTKEQTKKFYLSIILSLIALFLISCDNKDKTGAEEVKEEVKVKKEERTLSYYAGNWWGNIGTEKHLLTINTDGSITVKIGADDEKISSSSVTRVSDMIYTASHTISGESAKSTFIFSSDTQGNFTLVQGEGQDSVDITKK